MEVAPAVLTDIDRLLAPLPAFNVPDPAQNPEIGRRVNNAMRELIIGQKSRGYIALYRFIPDIDTVFILAIRSHREAGYR